MLSCGFGDRVYRGKVKAVTMNPVISIMKNHFEIYLEKHIMGRLKTFGKYILMIVAFYVFSTIVSAGFIRGTYADMGGKVYQGGNLSVYVDEAKSSFVNGRLP